MHSIMKSCKLRQARRARRAMKGAKQRGDPEGIPSRLAEKIDNFVSIEDWSDDQQPKQTAVGLAAQQALDNYNEQGRQ